MSDDGKSTPWTPIAPRPAEENEWQVGLCSTCYKDSGEFLKNCLCSCCSAYAERKKILQDDMSLYVCCNGVCFGDKIPCQKDCPEFCLCLESFCCITCAIHGNRNYLLEKYWIKDSCIEKCFLHCCGGSSTATVKGPNPMKGLCAICRCLPIIGDCPCIKEGEQCCPDNVECKFPCDCVSACFLTQHAIEMKKRAYPDDKIYRDNPYGAGGSSSSSSSSSDDEE
eukprot:TRINITY_DN5392_c0_g1_i1.p1 TRINITY_DN5392_c0_g1~~TRINITY_DN5392_c0_g1_i1.p1  ORF type:complete len:224 (-),score=44.75 TRINITY_DN5392_c0_g1_i1:266-937(-)